MYDDIPPRKILLIDNYDSYTYNIYQYLAVASGVPPIVLKNVDEKGLKKEYLSQFAGVVISPGPGNPNVDTDIGISKEVCRIFDGPVLGVCLGFQALALWEGCDIIGAPSVIHGELSTVSHSGSDVLFKGIPKNFRVVRYHSLIVNPDTVTDSVEIIGKTIEGSYTIPMALKIKNKPHWGVQYHPESVCTEYGQQLISNFVSICGIHQAQFPVSTSYSYEFSHKQPPCQRSITVKTIPLAEDVGVMGVFRNLFENVEDCVWLDSSDARGRYSIMASHDNSYKESFIVKYSIDDGLLNPEELPSTFIHQRESILTSLENYLESIRANGLETEGELELPFQGGFLGYVGYELRGECSKTTHFVSPLDLGSKKSSLLMPDLFMIYAERFLVVDHHRNLIHICHASTIDDFPEKQHWVTNIVNHIKSLSSYVKTDLDPVQKEVKFIPTKTKNEYINDIKISKTLINQGETYEVCLTNQFEAKSSITNSLSFYEQLRVINASPYAAFIKVKGHGSVCSSSPERFLKINCEGMCEAKPIKGTIKRSDDPVEDERLKNELRNSEKDQHENLMIVDLLRNDLGILSDIGSVTVPKLMDIESYKTVHQMVTTVRSKISKKISVVKVLNSTFPGGSIVGAPKTRTMDIIQKLENRRRGIYTGSIGYLSLHNAMDFNIAIRTAVISSTPDGTAVIRIGAGGAITALSDAESEWDEIMIKAYPLMRTVSKIITGDQQNYTVQLK